MDVRDREQSPHSTEMSILFSIIMGSEVRVIQNENQRGSRRDRKQKRDLESKWSSAEDAGSCGQLNPRSADKQGLDRSPSLGKPSTMYVFKCQSVLCSQAKWNESLCSERAILGISFMQTHHSGLAN